MKKILLAASLVLLMAVAAEAQITVTYTRETSNSRLTLRFQGGSFRGYGYGYGSAGFGGLGYGYGGTYRSVVAPGVAAGAYHPWGAGYHVGYPGYTYYSGPVRPIMDYYPGVPRPERSPENVATALLGQGRKRLRIADYKGAIEDIRSAVVADEMGGASEAWFALALALTGDVRNADKALRAALGHGFKGRLDLQLRDKKERARATAALAKQGGEASAYALSLLGQPEPLETLVEKDASLKPLAAGK